MTSRKNRFQDKKKLHSVSFRATETLKAEIG